MCCNQEPAARGTASLVALRLDRLCDDEGGMCCWTRTPRLAFSFSDNGATLHLTPFPAPFSGFNPDDFDGMQSRSPSMSSMASRGSRSTQSSKPPPRKMSMSTHNETYDLPQDSLAESLAATNAVVGYSYDGERWFHSIAHAQLHSACHVFFLASL